jgi:hypothetical protein
MKKVLQRNREKDIGPHRRIWNAWEVSSALAEWQMAPIPHPFLNNTEGAPGPSFLGTGNRCKIFPPPIAGNYVLPAHNGIVNDQTTPLCIMRNITGAVIAKASRHAAPPCSSKNAVSFFFKNHAEPVQLWVFSSRINSLKHSEPYRNCVDPHRFRADRHSSRAAQHA